MFKLRRFQGVPQRRTCIYVYTCAHVHSIHNLHLFVCQRARTQYPHARHTRTTATTTRRSAGLWEHCNAPSTVACLGNHVPGTCVWGVRSGAGKDACLWWWIFGQYARTCFSFRCWFRFTILAVRTLRGVVFSRISNVEFHYMAPRNGCHTKVDYFAICAPANADNFTGGMY